MIAKPRNLTHHNIRKVSGHAFLSSQLFLKKIVSRMNLRYVLVLIIVFGLAGLTATEAIGRDLKKSDASDGPLTSNPDSKSKSTDINEKRVESGDLAPENPDPSKDEGREDHNRGSGSQPGQVHLHQYTQDLLDHHLSMKVLQIKIDALLVICSFILIILIGSMVVSVLKKTRKSAIPKPESHKQHYCALGKACDEMGLMGGPGSCADCESALIKLRSGCDTCCTRMKIVKESAQAKAKDLAQGARKKAETQLDSLLAPAVERALLKIEAEK